MKGKIKINDELKASYRRGIVKELYSRGMITEQQYKRLLLQPLVQSGFTKSQYTAHEANIPGRGDMRSCATTLLRI